MAALVVLCVSPPGTSTPGAEAASGGGAADGFIWAHVQFSTPPTDGTSGPGGCRWTPALLYDAGIGQSSEVTRTVAGVLQMLYQRSCEGTVTLIWVSQPTPGQLGQLARDALIARLTAPRPRTAPPADRAIVLSNLWFWTAPSVWRDVSVTAWVPTPTGVRWARTTARPERLVFAPGAPGIPTVACAGPGRAWTDVDGDDAVSECSVTFLHDSSLEPGGRFQGLLGIDWSISWTSNSGGSGPLPGYRTTAPLAIVVSEIQALVTEVSR